MTRRSRTLAAAAATAATALLANAPCAVISFSFKAPPGHGIRSLCAASSASRRNSPSPTLRAHKGTPPSPDSARDSDERAGEDEDDHRRRQILLGSVGAIAASIQSGAGPVSAYADLDVPSVTVEDKEAIADGRVALEISTENLPARYTPSSSSSSSRTASLDSRGGDGIARLCEDPEARRISVFERAAPSVVYIDTFIERQDAFSPNVMEVPLGAGSGFIWDDKGHIVTNYHVVRNARSAQVAILSRVFDDEQGEETSGGGRALLTNGDDKVEGTGVVTTGGTMFERDTSPFTTMRPGSTSVTDFTRKVYKAKVVGVDPGKDIAVLKVDAPVYDLYPLELGTSKGVRVGQSVLAIGNPFGLDHTLTTGIISGVGREVKSPVGRPISNVIQTDAAINPGNSGGPLLDAGGRLIGMNTAIYSPTGASAGIGFAIPIDAVSYIVETLIRDGKIVRPVMGISYLESKQARALGITRGVLVLDVPESSPAYKSGMRGTRRTESGLIEIGDIIIGVDDNRIDTESDLFAAMEKYRPGDVVKVKVNRTELELDADDVGRSKLRMGEVNLQVQLKASSTALKPAMLIPMRPEEDEEVE